MSAFITGDDFTPADADATISRPASTATARVVAPRISSFSTRPRARVVVVVV